MNKCFVRKNIFLLLLITTLVMGGCSQSEEEQQPELDQSGNQPGIIASEYLSELSGMGARVAGTEAERDAGDWIQGTLEELGYTVTIEPFDYEVDGVKGTSENIIAVKDGKSGETIILGAHYDSVDAGDGSDDNGSGVAVVLEAATVLKDTEAPQTIKFIFFGAEEVGLCGSDYHVSQMTQEDIDQTVLMMNFDSLIAGDIAYVYGDADDNGKYRDLALEIAKEQNLDLITQPGDNAELPAGTTGDWSDHAPFKAAGIPHIYFESTNWTLGNKDGYTQVDLTLGIDGEIWHTKFDTMDYISTNFPDRIENRLSTFSTVTIELLSDDLSKL